MARPKFEVGDFVRFTNGEFSSRVGRVTATGNARAFDQVSVKWPSGISGSYFQFMLEHVHPLEILSKTVDADWPVK